MATKQRQRARPPSVACQYATAVSRAILETVHVLSPPEGAAVDGRKVINFLRGSRPPRQPARPGDSAPESFGLLQSHEAGWIEEVFDRLTEEGYLQLEAGPRGGRGVRLSRCGREAIRSPVLFPPEFLPARPLLGSNPEIEDRLWNLRRRISRAEGRTAFAVFPNAVLAALAQERPANLASLSTIRGLGEARIRKYGRKILAALRPPSRRRAEPVSCSAARARSTTASRPRRAAP